MTLDDTFREILIELRGIHDTLKMQVVKQPPQDVELIMDRTGSMILRAAGFTHHVEEDDGA